jgi:hypothetical protein
MRHCNGLGKFIAVSVNVHDFVEKSHSRIFCLAGQVSLLNEGSIHNWVT